MQKLLLQKTPSALIWVVSYLLSLTAMFYLGLNPEYILIWWWPLVAYNLLMSLFAIYYIAINVNNLRKEIQQNIIGSKFTWSFIKMVPILVILPVASFYLFSFQTIQTNVNNARQTFADFTSNINQRAKGLSQGAQDLHSRLYTQRSSNIVHLIASNLNFNNEGVIDKPGLETFLVNLIAGDFACKISVSDSAGNDIAASEHQKCAQDEDIVTVNIKSNYLILAPDNYLVVNASFLGDQKSAQHLKDAQFFTNLAASINFQVNTSITQRRFLIDFTSTILLSIVVVLIIVLRMMRNLMKPLNSLSIATKEIAKGNYDVQIVPSESDLEMHDLLARFNDMSKQIKISRQGLDTHNLYLETILQYSYGVIGLDEKNKIRLINPIIGQMLKIDEQSFIGKDYKSIATAHPDLSPLFDFIERQFNLKRQQWTGQIELNNLNHGALFICQGATLKASENVLGYVIVINDISNLNRAQKKAAWGEVAQRMAHEIKNPLTPIMLSAQRLRNKFINKLNQEDSAIIDKTTKVIIEQVSSMSQMVSSFSEYANTPKVERKQVQLNEIIKHATELYKAQEKVEIKLDLEEQLPELMLDANSISRALINMIKNSSEARADATPVQIVISTKIDKKANKVLLKIQDNGDGFDKKIMTKVFEPYMTLKTKGSGLGMAIVQNIIDQHNGRISIKNAKQGGAIVTIYFNL